MTARNKGTLSRRGFLAGSVAAASAPFMIAPRHAIAGAKEKAPSEKLNIAGIGIGGVGSRNLANLPDERVVALCDVDDNYAAPVFQAFADARRYKDFREMLAAEKDLDGVVIATPDHSHAVISAAVIRAGIPVFCQKPLTHDVNEARQLAKLAKETEAITQMGIQGHAGEGTWNLRHWIRSGLIGEVREVEAWCTDTYYPWGHASWSPKQGFLPTDEVPVPDGFDWDRWLGPIAHHPYQPCYHPRSWRAFWDFGSGWMADRGAHSLDPVVWALDLGQPTLIDATCTGATEHLHPVSAVVRFEFPKRKKQPPVTITWYTGLRAPRPTGVPAGDDFGDRTGGIIFKGSDGILTCDTYGERPRLLPSSRMKDFTPPALDEPWPGRSIETDWAWAIRNGKKACADFAYSGPLTEICMLGNIAKRVGGTIEWDTKQMTVTNNPDANQYVATQYREGWTI
ncbi:MAG: Gfo/Idh/MocA family oxidoreductase [Candidatus Hydrogenedentes bacterium]|nr:Gfo/Idh/MocA family oxidoreductase [Candidatus Hydrogenedentota bacterium]